MTLSVPGGVSHKHLSGRDCVRPSLYPGLEDIVAEDVMRGPEVCAQVQIPDLNSSLTSLVPQFIHLKSGAHNRIYLVR